MKYHAKRRWGGLIFLAPYVASFLVFIVAPLLFALVLAFMQFDLTARDKIQFIGLKNFQDALNDPHFWQALKATLGFVVLMVPGLVIFALAAAIGLNAMGKGRNAVRAMIYLPGMLNVAVTTILWRWFYDGQFGLFNFVLKNLGLDAMPWLSERSFANPSIVLMSLWWSMGGTCIVLLAALQQIPRAIVEAAGLDGATGGKMFSQITLPLLRPVLFFVVITSTIGGFQVFGQSFLLTRGGPELATRGLVQYIYETAFNNYRMGYGAAMGWLLFLVVAVLALVQFKILHRRVA